MRSAAQGSISAVGHATFQTSKMKKKKKTTRKEKKHPKRKTKEHPKKHNRVQGKQAKKRQENDMRLIPRKSLISNKFFIFLVLFGLLLLAFKLYSMTDEQNQAPFGGFTILNQMVMDEELDDEEVQTLSSLDCEDLHELLGDGREACIYFEDMDGELIDLDNDGVIGYGCSDYVIHGKKICRRIQ